MSENRSGFPYISHFKATYRPTKNWVPAGQNQQGEDMLRQVVDRPSIEVEVTPFLSDSDTSPTGPATVVPFPVKAFFQSALDEVKAKAKTVENDKIIAAIEKTIARTDVVWAESLFASIGITSIEELWASVISDAMDVFPKWNEATNGTFGAGIPLIVLPMQLDARIPYLGKKSIELKVGVYATKVVSETVDGATVKKHVPIGDPRIYTLVFLDAAGMAERTALDDQVRQRIETLQQTLAGMSESDPNVGAVTQEIADRQAFLAARAEDDVASIDVLFGSPGVGESLVSLFGAVIVSLTNLWPDLDVTKVQPRLQAFLANLIPIDVGV